MERLLRLTDLMWTNYDRSVRARRMAEWALLCRVRDDDSSMPRDPYRFRPDKSSSLSLDDLDFAPELGEHVVSSTARFPVATAAESLVGASQVYAASIEQKRASTLSTGILCRCAIESAAKTIWLLAHPSREVRRARCLGFSQVEFGYQRGYIAVEERFFAMRPESPEKAREYETFKETERDYQQRLKFINTLPKSARERPPASYEEFIKWAGKWIDDHPPPHITDGNGLKYGMSTGAERFYTVGSGFVHGYKWMTDYIGTEEDVLAQIADSLAAALIMTECAVALYEAQATHPSKHVVRKQNYPEYLEKTVLAWRPTYDKSPVLGSVYAAEPPPLAHR